jgi:hypothetical protein
MGGQHYTGPLSNEDQKLAVSALLCVALPNETVMDFT